MGLFQQLQRGWTSKVFRYQRMTKDCYGLSRWGTRCTHQFAHFVHVQASSVKILTHTQTRHMQNPYNKTCFSFGKKSAVQLNGQAKSLDAAADRVSFNTTLAACAAGQARIFNKNFGPKQCLCYVWSCIQKLDAKSIYMCPLLTSRC